MKTLSLEKMEVVNAGSKASERNECLFLGVGGIFLAVGLFAAAVVTGPVSWLVLAGTYASLGISSRSLYTCLK